MASLLLAVIYLACVSLGLPDSLLGSAWPAIYQEFNAPVSYAGIVSTIISIGTVISSLMSDRLTRRLGTAKILIISTAISVVSLVGFSFCNAFWMLCLWAIPYGLGGGSIDAALNNYVALHYKSRHMNWLHSMWGIGASVGPYIMGYALTGQGWPMGYRYVAVLQFILTVILLVSLPLWKGHGDGPQDGISDKPLSFRQILRIPGTKTIMVTFFCYCAVEQTTGLWASSYLVLYRGFSEDTAANFASLFFIGITLGRILSGFLTLKFKNVQMIHLGMGIVMCGVIALLLPLREIASLIGLMLVGLGCAPIYPCLLHSTPDHFGADKAQAIMGVQMASAYVGICVMPPLFGLIANHISVTLLPVYLLSILILMVGTYEKLVRSRHIIQHG